MILLLKWLSVTFVHKKNWTFCEQTTENVIIAVLCSHDCWWSNLICALWNVWYLSKGLYWGETMLDGRCWELHSVVVVVEDNDFHFSHLKFKVPLIWFQTAAESRPRGRQTQVFVRRMVLWGEVSETPGQDSWLWYHNGINEAKKTISCWWDQNTYSSHMQLLQKPWLNALLASLNISKHLTVRLYRVFNQVMGRQIQKHQQKG